MPANPTTVAVAGILVSGVVGPTATSWAARRAARRQFLRDRAATKRNELLNLLDQATAALALGATRLRELREAASASSSAEAGQLWAEEIFTYGQRLALRLGQEHAVVTSYEAVRLALVEMGGRGEVSTRSPEYEDATRRFEERRGEFLAQARSALQAPISEKEGAE